MKNRGYKSGIIGAVFSLLILFLSSCATYYQKNEHLMEAVYDGKFETANKLLENDSKWEKPDRNKLLFYLNKGTVLWMQGDYVNSNLYFRKADYFVEDYNKNVGDAALTMLVNARMSTYCGENFEQILIHYYGALNYLSLDQTESALIEGKRMLEKMQKITDRYQNKNKYRRDAFAHNLLGLIYEIRGEYNDAFIAYKNAYEVYKEDYTTTLNTPAPLQLKKDLLRMAKAIGFFEEVRLYEEEFGLKAESLDKGKGSVLCFWNNGLGPVKDQFSINIAIVPAGSGWVQFVNLEMGISIPIQVDEKDDRKDLLDMKFIRLAFPKYISRNPIYQSAILRDGDTKYDFHLAEDIDAIAYKSLSDRMGRELAIGILRVALKQLAIHKAQQDKNNSGLAAAAMIYGAVSEQADTRNWQLLPYSINYSRIPLEPGKHNLKFEAQPKTQGNVFQKDLEVEIKKGQTRVIAVQTIGFSGFDEK